MLVHTILAYRLKVEGDNIEKTEGKRPRSSVGPSGPSGPQGPDGPDLLAAGRPITARSTRSWVLQDKDFPKTRRLNIILKYIILAGIVIFYVIYGTVALYFYFTDWKIYIEFVWQKVDPWFEKTLFCFIISFIHTWSVECVHTYYMFRPPLILYQGYTKWVFLVVHKNMSFRATIPCWQRIQILHIPSLQYQAMSMSWCGSYTQSTQFLWLTPGVPSTFEQTMTFASFCILYLRHILCDNTKFPA